MSDDDDGLSYQFGLTLEINDEDDTLDITLTDVPRRHVPYMFSTTIADVIATSLMDAHMLEIEPVDDDNYLEGERLDYTDEDDEDDQ